MPVVVTFRTLAVLCAGLVTLLGAGAAGAQAYPVKQVRLILPFPPGGPTDLLGRAIAQKLGEQMGQTVVADNRPGAGGNLGIELAAKSPPDGYTMAHPRSSRTLSRPKRRATPRSSKMRTFQPSNRR